MVIRHVLRTTPENVHRLLSLQNSNPELVKNFRKIYLQEKLKMTAISTAKTTNILKTAMNHAYKKSNKMGGLNWAHTIGSLHNQVNKKKIPK